MVTNLFEGHLQDPELYRRCQEYWEQLVEEVATSLGQTGEWKRWVPRTLADGGTPIPIEFLEIHDGRSTRMDRGFKVYQGPASRKDIPEATAWLTHEEEFAAFPRDELTIGLSLSEETAALARTLLRKWMDPSTTPAEMPAFIDQALQEAGVPPIFPPDDPVGETAQDGAGGLQ